MAAGSRQSGFPARRDFLGERRPPAIHVFHRGSRFRAAVLPARADRAGRRRRPRRRLRSRRRHGSAPAPKAALQAAPSRPPARTSSPCASRRSAACPPPTATPTRTRSPPTGRSCWRARGLRAAWPWPSPPRPAAASGAPRPPRTCAPRKQGLVLTVPSQGPLRAHHGAAQPRAPHELLRADHRRALRPAPAARRRRSSRPRPPPRPAARPSKARACGSGT